MMKTKKFIAALLCGTMLLSGCLTGCNQEETSDPAEAYHTSRTQGISYDVSLGSVTEYSVMLPVMATESEKYAAKELISHVEQITGVTLAYTDDSAYTDAKVISIGRTAFLESSGEAADKTVLGSDGFIMKTKGNALLICGGEDRGTIYGVLDFLEYHLGVKFLTADYTYIPDAEKALVYQCDRTEIPAFEYRLFLDADSFYNENPEINVRHRFTSEYLRISEDMGGNMKWYQEHATHNALFWAQIENYVVDGAVAPQYVHAFSNDGSKIIIDPVSAGEYCQYAADLCYCDGINEDGSYYLTAQDGTPTALAMAVEGMKKVIRNDKNENNYYMFGQNDYFNRPCLCPKCTEASKKYTDTGIMIRFFNALAEEIARFVEEEGIDRQVSIVMFAYQYSSDAPVKQNEAGELVAVDTTCIPRKNLVIRLAPIGTNRFVSYEHDAQNDNSYGSGYMAEWGSIASNFMLWEYTTHHPRWYWYVPTLPAWHDRLVTARNMGVNYVMLQSTHQEYTIYQSVLERYVQSKLLWNPEYDVTELVSEFHKYYLGDIAAPYADEYVEMITAACYEYMEENNYSTNDFFNYSNKGLLKSALATLDSAIAAVDSSNLSAEEKDMYISRIELMKLQPRYMYLYNYMQYENDEVQMKNEVRQFIIDAMSMGAQWCREGCPFDLDNLVFY